MNGADWKTMGWVEYQTSLAFWNQRHSDDGGKQTRDPDEDGRMSRFMAAHSVH
jgi:hypothetical protein